MHSKIQAAGKVICKGRRGQIMGGEILAGEEVRVKQLGAQASTPTLMVVGMNPKILQQKRDLERLEEESKEKVQKVEQNIRTLKWQKQSARAKFPPEKEEMLERMLETQTKLTQRIKEIKEEKPKIEGYLSQLSNSSAVHVEKTLFPAVTIEINGARFISKEEYNRITLIEEGGNIKMLPYQEDKK